MFAISPTDIDWFNFLRDNGYHTQINFWTPSLWNISQLKPGNKLYFMLKSPIRKIGGYGHFVEYKNLPLKEAWNTYGRKNGCHNKLELINRLKHYNKSIKEVDNQKIGCIILENAEFYDDLHFLNLEEYEINFHRSVQKIKYFKIYDPLTQPINHKVNEFELVPYITKRQKKTTKITPRIGQGTFRGKISQVYNNKCCVSGESTAELLEAAHIQPYINEHSNHIQNGLLLRVDIHKMYDNGLLYIDEHYEIHISSLIKSTHYLQLQGKKISIPENTSLQPSKNALMARKPDFRI